MKSLAMPDRFYEAMVIQLAEKYEAEDNPLEAVKLLETYLGHEPGEQARRKCAEIKTFITHANDRARYQATYDKAARLRLGFYDKKITVNPRFRWLAQKLDSGKAKKVLDVGCYRGEFSIALAKLGYDATGIDISEKNIKIANKIKAGTTCHFQTGFAEDIAIMFAPASFDAVFLFEILEHVIDPTATLAAAEKVVRPGGWILVTVPITYSEYGYHQILKKDLLLRFYARFTTNYREHLRKFDQESITKLFGHKRKFSLDVIQDKTGSWQGISYQV